MAVFPGGVSTDADLSIAVNNLACTLNGAIDNAVTTVTVNSTTGFPTAGYITIDTEIIKYTSTSGTQFLGCTRGADGSANVSHSDLTTVYHNIVAAHHNALKDEVKAIEQNISDRFGLGSTDVYTTDYTDFSATSTIVGFSSFTFKQIYYKKLGKLVYVWFRINGTSDNASTTFTVPHTAANTLLFQGAFRGTNAGTDLSTPCMWRVTNNSNIITLYKDFAFGAWTASGAKETDGFLVYQTT